MATNTSIRVVGLSLQQVVNKLFSEMSPIYSVASTWTLNGLDDDLPVEGDIREQMAAYNAINKMPIGISDALNDIRTSEGSASPPGTYQVPITAAPITFSVSGPIILGTLGHLAIGASCTIERITLLCITAGTGDDLVIDVKKNTVSLFASQADMPTIPANTTYTVDITGGHELLDAALASEDLLTIDCIQKPSVCEDILLTIWIKSSE